MIAPSTHMEVIMSHITHAEPVARVPQRALWILAAALATAAIVVTLVIVLSSGSSGSSEPAAQPAAAAKVSPVNYEELPAYPSPESSPPVDYGNLPAYPSPRPAPFGP
jgi:hypothetical protein